MKKPLVIGHKGEIGSFLVNGLLKYMDKALDILCFDVNETQEEVEERIKKSDVIFLCVPVKQTVNWLKTYKSLLSGKIIFEQASLK
jgi:prephenate dehydrogenase